MRHLHDSDTDPITPEEALERQRVALETTGQLRDELIETAPAKMMKGLVTLVAIGFVAYFLLGRR